jgi:hypothetical protein
MLAHRKNIEWLCSSQYPVAYAHRQRSVALRAKTGSRREGGPSGLEVFRRLGNKAGCAAQTAIDHGKSPDTFLILAQDPLPLRLCTFAPLRSFLPAAGMSARDPLPKEPYARSSPSPPPPPTPPAKALGARGSQAVGFVLWVLICRRLGGAGCAAQTTIEQGKSPDTFLISARDPLPLRLCTFAPLRSFLPAAGMSARDPLPKEPYARSSPSPPPPPSPPAKALGARGSQAVGFAFWVLICRRVS